MFFLAHLLFRFAPVDHLEIYSEPILHIHKQFFVTYFQAFWININLAVLRHILNCNNTLNPSGTWNKTEYLTKSQSCKKIMLHFKP